MEEYDVSAVATVDSRGQIVLPKDAREAIGVTAGSKLAVVVQRRDGRACCVVLMPVGELEVRVREIVAPAAGRRREEA